MTGTMMRLYDQYDINPPSSAPSVFAFRLLRPRKPIMPFMNIYCSNSAPQTLKYENSGPVTSVLFLLNVSPTPAEACEERRGGGILFYML